MSPMYLAWMESKRSVFIFAEMTQSDSDAGLDRQVGLPVREGGDS